MKKLILIAALVISTTTLLQAQTANQTCPEVVPKHFKAVYQEAWGMLTQFEVDEEIYQENTPKLNTIACDQFKLLARSIMGVKKKFGSYLKYPKNVVVNMIKKDGNAYNMSGYLNLPLSLFVYNNKYKEMFKHPKHNIPVWVHEYGHSVFNQMMGASSKKWGLLANARERYKMEMVKFTARHNTLLRSCKVKYQILKKKGISKEEAAKKLSQECGKPIKALRKQNIKMSETIFNGAGPAINLFIATGPYNEFFADVLAVSFLNNGAAVHDALYRSGINYHKSPHKSLGRDFTTHKNDLDVLERQPAHFIQPGVHNLFSAARRHAWKYYLSNPIYKAKIGLTTQAIFKAIYSEVVQLESVFRKQPALAELMFPSEYIEYTPEQHAIIKRVVVVMNQNLIKVMDQELKKI